MSIEKNSQENIQNDSDAYYETNASQEEIYLEEVEEELRAIVTSDDPSPHNSTIQQLNCWRRKREQQNLAGGQRSMTADNNDPRMAESLEEQLDHAAEELITGDSDDPPLSEEALLEMIRSTHMPKPSGS